METGIIPFSAPDVRKERPRVGDVIYATDIPREEVDTYRETFKNSQKIILLDWGASVQRLTSHCISPDGNKEAATST